MQGGGNRLGHGRDRAGRHAPMSPRTTTLTANLYTRKEAPPRKSPIRVRNPGSCALSSGSGSSGAAIPRCAASATASARASAIAWASLSRKAKADTNASCAAKTARWRICGGVFCSNLLTKAQAAPPPRRYGFTRCTRPRIGRRLGSYRCTRAFRTIQKRARHLMSARVEQGGQRYLSNERVFRLPRFGVVRKQGE